MGVARRCEELRRDGWLVKMRGDRLGVERMMEGWSMRWVEGVRCDRG